MNVNDLLFDLGLDNINMFQLARWVRDNKMAFKVGSLGDKSKVGDAPECVGAGVQGGASSAL